MLKSWTVQNCNSVLCMCYSIEGPHWGHAQSESFKWVHVQYEGKREVVRMHLCLLTQTWANYGQHCLEEKNTLYNICSVFSPWQSAPSGSRVHSSSTFSEQHASISLVSKRLRKEKRAILDLFGLLCFLTVFLNRPFMRSKRALIPLLSPSILYSLRLACFMTHSKHIPTFQQRISF